MGGVFFNYIFLCIKLTRRLDKERHPTLLLNSPLMSDGAMLIQPTRSIDYIASILTNCCSNCANAAF